MVIELQKSTPYLTCDGELCGVYCEDLGANWQCYNDTAI